MPGLDDQDPSKPAFDQVTSQTSEESTALPNAEQKNEQKAQQEKAIDEDIVGAYRENAADITARPEVNQPPPQGGGGGQFSTAGLDLNPPIYAPDRSTERNEPASMLTPTGRLGDEERARHDLALQRRAEFDARREQENMVQQERETRQQIADRRLAEYQANRQRPIDRVEDFNLGSVQGQEMDAVTNHARAEAKAKEERDRDQDRDQGFSR